MKIVFSFVYLRSETFNDLNDLVRNSPYYCRLPHLPIECVELDGLPETLPILIEEIYSAIDEEIRVRPTTTTTASSTETSSPKISLPTKNVLAFRKQTTKNVNPVVASSNDSPVRLTSFKKMTENSIPRRSFQRSNSSSQIEDLPVDLSPIPSFLRSPSTEKIDDEVFDTSLKSKVLQNSFRGKQNTKERRTASLSNFSPTGERSTSFEIVEPPISMSHNDRIQHNSNINSQTIE